MKVVREIKLMKELNKMPEGAKYVPKLYDVIVVEDTGSEKGNLDSNLEKGHGNTDNLRVYLVMEYFSYDLRELIVTCLRDFDEKKLLKLKLLYKKKFLKLKSN